MTDKQKEKLVNGNGDNDDASNNKLVKKLYGIPNDRGGTDWLEKCPDYMQSSSEHPEHAIVTRYMENRQLSSRKRLNLVSIDIQDPDLKLLVRRIFRSYPGAAVDEEGLVFEAPFYPFLHSWATIEAAREAPDAPKEQIDALMDAIRAEFGRGLKDAQNLAKNGNISFDLLWMLFPPGCPVVGDLYGRKHLMLINEAKYLSGEIIPTLALEMIQLDHTGERYGWRKTGVFVQAFSGSMKIQGLPLVPLFFQEGVEDILELLQKRGTQAEELIRNAPVYRAYEGPTRLHRSYDMEEVEIFMEGRIMLDPKTHSQQAPRHSPNASTIPHKLECLLSRDSTTKIVTESKRESYGLLSILDNLNQHPILRVGTTKLQHIAPTDSNDRSLLRHHRWTEHLLGLRPELFTRSVIRGYTLTSKCWAEFEIDRSAPIQWNADAFSSLVIPPARKRLLEALVRQQQHNKADADFEDFVKGKGQGLIMLLAGPPGTGKTLTAESVADRLQLPLYAVSASELGDSAKQIEEGFGQVLRLAASWDAVLLLDEADAFLEKRVDAEVARDRNKRVAAFLRILEYYKGILILTTNRTVNFDDAFYSRIHLSLSFAPLDYASRLDIWRNFLRSDGQAGIGEDDLKEFAKEKLNGRQIKNIMKMARLLAKDEGKKGVDATCVRDVLDVAREDLHVSSSVD